MRRQTEGANVGPEARYFLSKSELDFISSTGFLENALHIRSDPSLLSL